MVPRSRKYYEGATTSHWRIDDRLFFSLPSSTWSSCLLCPPWRSWRGWRPPPGPGIWLPPAVPTTSRGRQWDLSSIQVIHPVPLLRSWTPVEPMYPCLGGHTDAAPA